MWPAPRPARQGNPLATIATTSEPATERRTVWRPLLRAAVTLALIVYLSSTVDWRQVGHLLRVAYWPYWGLAWLTMAASQVASATRWSRLARAVGLRGAWTKFVRLYFEGSFFSLTLPTSVGGDVWKAYGLVSTNSERLLAGCTVLADRLAGLAALTIIGATALAQRSAGLSPLATAGCALAITLAAAVAVFAGTGLLRRIGPRLTSGRSPTGLLSRLTPYYDRPRLLCQAVAWGLGVQFMNVCVVQFLAASLGMEAPSPMYFVAVPLVALATVAPISFNGIGVREGGLAWILAGYGVSETSAVALGLSWFVVINASGLLGGPFYAAGRSRIGEGSIPADGLKPAAPAPVSRPIVASQPRVRS